MGRLGYGLIAVWNEEARDRGWNSLLLMFLRTG